MPPLAPLSHLLRLFFRRRSIDLLVTFNPAPVLSARLPGARLPGARLPGACTPPVHTRYLDPAAFDPAAALGGCTPPTRTHYPDSTAHDLAATLDPPTFDPAAVLGARRPGACAPSYPHSCSSPARFRPVRAYHPVPVRAGLFRPRTLALMGSFQARIVCRAVVGAGLCRHRTLALMGSLQAQIACRLVRRPAPVHPPGRMPAYALTRPNLSTPRLSPMDALSGRRRLYWVMSFDDWYGPQRELGLYPASEKILPNCSSGCFRGTTLRDSFLFVFFAKRIPPPLHFEIHNPQSLIPYSLPSNCSSLVPRNDLSPLQSAIRNSKFSIFTQLSRKYKFRSTKTGG